MQMQNYGDGTARFNTPSDRRFRPINVPTRSEKGSPEAWGCPFAKEDYNYDAFFL